MTDDLDLQMDAWTFAEYYAIPLTIACISSASIAAGWGGVLFAAAAGVCVGLAVLLFMILSTHNVGGKNDQRK